LIVRGQSGIASHPTTPGPKWTTGDVLPFPDTTIHYARPTNATKRSMPLVWKKRVGHASRTQLRGPTYEVPNASPRMVCGSQPPQELLLLRRLRIMPVQRQQQRGYGPKRACLGGTGLKMEVDLTLAVRTAQCDGRCTGWLELV